MGRFKKNILIWLVFILLIVIMIIAGLIIYLNLQDDLLVTQVEEEVETSEEYNESLEKVKDKQEYLSVKNTLNSYISAINQNSSIYYGYDKNNNYTIVADEETINTNIYNVLSEDYIKKNAINLNNVRNFVYTIKEDCFYIPIDIYIKEEFEDVKVYAIYGIIENMDYEPITQSYLILNIDERNNTFSVEQLESEEQLNSKKIQSISSIENKGNNIYKEAGLLDEELIIDYMTTYKRLALAYPEIVYNNYLDDEYKIKKFNSLEKYKEYVNNNKEKIKSINVQKYNVEKQAEYTQYIAIDQNEKNYIFNIRDINDFKVILDTYTIDIPQFTEKYNNASDVNKVGYNIQKCIDAINDEDYTYVYNKLDKTFKENNYKTEDIFKNFIKNNLYTKNEVEGNAEFSRQGEVYIYNINIKNSNNSNENKNMTVIMKLEEGTDFIMSFNIE